MGIDDKSREMHIKVSNKCIGNGERVVVTVYPWANTRKTDRGKDMIRILVTRRKQGQLGWLTGVFSRTISQKSINSSR